MIIFNELTCKMSAEKYSSYTEAFREFRINIAENDFHDDYPATVEMTLAICSGLRYHFIRNYRSMLPVQSIQLIETFAKRCAKLEDYRNMLNDCLYGPKSMITHKHWDSDRDSGFNEWLLLCYMYGLIDLNYEHKREIQRQFAYMDRYVKRTEIQLKILDKDIKLRIELQQELSEKGKLINRIDEFNHLFKFTSIPSIDMKTGHESYKHVIDTYYDGRVDEKLGKDTIYEWILNDDHERFRQWYIEGGLQQYLDRPNGEDMNLIYREDIAAHILDSKAVKIIRFIIMNDIHEFLDEIDGMWALMDPWRYPVNDAECFRILQERFMESHKHAIECFMYDSFDSYGMPENVYRLIKSEIADAIYHEIIETLRRLYGNENAYLQLYVAISMAKFGHISPIESLDWDIITKTLSDKSNYTVNNGRIIFKLAQLMRSRYDLITKHCECLPFGMNPSTAVYIHDLFSENGLVKIALPEQLLDKYYADLLGVNINRDNQIVMAEHEEEEWVCTDDELYW